MPQMAIPFDEHGYAVDPSGTVHRRYAAHARGLPRTRTLDSATAYIKGTPLPCPECWPETKPKAKPVSKARAKGGPVVARVDETGDPE